MTTSVCGECKTIGEKLQEVDNDILELSPEERERIKSIIYYQRRDDIGINCVCCPERYNDDIVEEILCS
jgi:hypothetical protein